MNIEKMAVLFAVITAMLSGEKARAGAEPTKDMALIPTGTFMMGDDTIYYPRSSHPVHRVYLDEFFMDTYEVTVTVWEGVYNWAISNGYIFTDPFVPVQGDGPNYPVYLVRWYDVVKWCNARSEKEGRVPAYYTNAEQTVVYRVGSVDIQNNWVKWDTGYRLPTEAEWEYACRAGTTTSYYTGEHATTRDLCGFDKNLNRAGWYCGNQSRTSVLTHEVGLKEPNAWGLYDMHGNVEEWCWDWWDSYVALTVLNPRGPAVGRRVRIGAQDYEQRILRGGSWSSWTYECRSAFRNLFLPGGFNGAGGFRTVLSQTGWKSVIEAQPAQPTYGEGPEKLPGKDSLVVVTHGWQPSWKPVDISWVEEMTNRIARFLENRGQNNWQMHAHRWVEKARTRTPQGALNNAKHEGQNLGSCLAAQKWNHIHLIGFSAGAGLIQAASESTKKGSLNTTTVHATFLDAFVGLTQTEKDEYGKHADWADSYFSHDMDTFGDIATWTEGPFQSVYNVDVTWLDLSKKPITVIYSTPSGDISKTCYQTVSSHKWPREFYADTIPPNSVFGSDGFGFPLSKEAGGWVDLPARDPVGNNPPRVLGNAELVCPKLETQLTVSVVSQPDLTGLELIKSETGTVIIHGSNSFSLKTSSPVWLVLPIIVTNKVNFVSFKAQFTSANSAEGLLSVYWKTNTVGSVDERLSPVGSRLYSFQLPYTVANGVGLAGFRLDAFSGVPSSVSITNVTLGFAGIREPFTLAVTDTLASGALVLQLKGSAGFNYAVESSTNLTNWEVAAMLVNTNGTVRFAVPLETNAAARFYHAVAPQFFVGSSRARVIARALFVYFFTYLCFSSCTQPTDRREYRIMSNL